MNMKEDIVSEDAKTAYPDTGLYPEAIVALARDAFDRGMATAQAVSLPDRETLAQILDDNSIELHAEEYGTGMFFSMDPAEIADAVLAALSPASIPEIPDNSAATLGLLIDEARATLAQHDRVWVNTSGNPLPTSGVSAALRKVIPVLAALSTQPAAGEVEGYVALRDLIDECMDDALHDSEMSPAELLSTVLWDHGYRREGKPAAGEATCSACGVTVTDETPSAFYMDHDERCSGELREPETSPELADLFPGTLAALDNLSIRPEVQ